MDNSSPNPASAKPVKSSSYSFLDLQAKVLTTFLVGTAIACILELISIWNPSTPVLYRFLIAAFLALLAGTFIPMRYVLRALLLLAVLFGLAVVEGVRTGIFGNTRLFFLALLAASAMLFNRREFFIALGISTAGLALIGWLLSTSAIILGTPEVTIGNLTTWIVGTLIMVLLAFGLGEGWARLRKEYFVTQATVKNAMSTLTNERVNFETRFSERKKETESVADALKKRMDFFHNFSEVLRTTASLPEPAELMDSIVKNIGQKFNTYYVGIYLNDDNNAFTVLQTAYGANSESLLSKRTKVKIDQSGIVNSVASTGKPHISKRVKDDLLYEPNLDLLDTQAVIALPLLKNERIIGVLDLEYNRENEFSDQDVEVMSTLADQVAAAIENSRTLSKTRQALAEASAVYRQYLHQAWEKLVEDKRTVGYRYAASSVNPLETPLDLPEINTAIEYGQTMIASEEKSTITVPLKLRDEVIGVLDIRSNNPGRQWTENELAVIQAVAERVSLALENARLFEETTRRADRERTVSEITTHIRSTTDPQTMLTMALEELKQALGAKDIHIRPYSPPSPEKSDKQGPDKKTEETIG